MWEGTRAARQPPPLWWQRPHGCSCPGTGCLRRVGHRWAGGAAGKSHPGRQLGKQMVQSAGERRHLPARAVSQGDGAAPCRHPQALLGQGAAGQAESPHPISPPQNMGVLTSAWEQPLRRPVCTPQVGRCRSHASTSVAGRSWLSSLLASSIQESIFGRALGYWHRSHLVAM